MFEQHSEISPYNGSDGVPPRIPKEFRGDIVQFNLAKRINRRLNDYSALITAITGLTVAIYTLSSIIQAIYGLGR